MCLLALFFRVAEDAPVIVGANREEDYDRPSEPPQILEGPCRIIAGLDQQAKGTWLGVNEHGVLVAVTNRLKTDEPTEPRSRGLLVRDLLASPSAAIAVGIATRELDSHKYRGCNLLCADKERAVMIHGGDWLRVRPLPPGVHVVSSISDVNDGSDPRVLHAQDWLNQRAYHHSDHCLNALRQICSQTNDPPICLIGDRHGTVSSSLIALRPRLHESIYLHAQGPPHQTPYQDFSDLFQTIGSFSHGE